MSHRFDVLELSTDVAGQILGLLDGDGGVYRDLVDQCRRAAVSVALNVAEANGRTGRDRAYHFRIAYGSAAEASTALRLLTRAGRMPAARVAELEAGLDRVRAMSWRLAGR